MTDPTPEEQLAALQKEVEAKQKMEAFAIEYQALLQKHGVTLKLSAQFILSEYDLPTISGEPSKPDVAVVDASAETPAVDQATTEPSAVAVDPAAEQPAAPEPAAVEPPPAAVAVSETGA